LPMLFEEVMDRIGNAPRIINWRFWRKMRWTATIDGLSTINYHIDCSSNVFAWSSTAALQY
jgi:hypothetical protein